MIFLKRIIPLLLSLILLTSCAAVKPTEPVSRDIFAMDTYMTVTCMGDRAEEALDKAEAEIKRLDALLSVGNESSEISAINRDGEGQVSDESRSMIEKSIEIYNGTDGAFDITVYPIMEAWGFTDGNFRIPDSAELTDLLSAAGTDKLTLDGDKITLGEGQGIDLGGIAKGYTSDRLTEIFADCGLDYGIISLGGNVQFYGAKPDGSPWRCGIKNPYNTEDLIAVLTVDDVAVITSGGYERYFTGEDGNTYHHIIDPKTGISADSGIVSATIISKSGTLADGLSTACFVMGVDRASEYWRTRSQDFDMVLVTESGEMYVTAGLEGKVETSCDVYIIK